MTFIQPFFNFLGVHMNRIIVIFLIAIAAMFAGASAFAQQPCIPAPIIMGQGYQGGAPCWGQQPNDSTRWVQPSIQQIQQGQQIQQVMLPVQNNPGFYTSGGNTYRCSTLTTVGGAIVGALIGYHLGEKIHIDNNGTLRVLGGVAGAGIGSKIACELVTSNNQPSNSGQLVQLPNNPVTTSSLSICTVDGSPELTKRGLTEEGCLAYRQGLSVTKVSEGRHCFINKEGKTKKFLPPVGTSTEEATKYCNGIISLVNTSQMTWDNIPGVINP